jgi:hypothetical protein
MHSSPTSMAANKLRPACPFLRLRALSCARIRQHRAPALRHRREIHLHRVVHLCHTAALLLSRTNVANPPCRDERASLCTSPALVASRQPGSCHSELLLPRPARQLGNPLQREGDLTPAPCSPLPTACGTAPQRCQLPAASARAGSGGLWADGAGAWHASPTSALGDSCGPWPSCCGQQNRRSEPTIASIRSSNLLLMLQSSIARTSDWCIACRSFRHI